MVCHFLITRFNIKRQGWGKDKNDLEVLDNKWIINRISLFKRYCLPSVLAQTSKKFRWLIIFQNENNKEIEELIAKTLKKYHFIEPFFVNGYDEFLSSIASKVQEKLPPDAKWILTTRLDNDDALHKDFLRIVRESVRLRHNSVVHFPYGLCLDIHLKKRLAQQYHPLNQFVTLVEDIQQENGTLKTVFTNPHNKWGDEYSIKPIRKDNLWLQVTHSGNMINEYGGTPAFSKKLEGFCIEKPKFSTLYDVKVAMHRLKSAPERLKKFF